MTALFVAAHCGFEDVVRILLEAGADMTLAVDDGTTPLAIAQRKSRYAIVSMLKVANAQKYMS